MQMQNDLNKMVKKPSQSCFFFSSRRRHTRSYGDWSSDVCSSDLFFRSGQSVRAQHRITAPQPFLFSLCELQPCVDCIIGQVRWNAVESRVGEIQQMGELVIAQDRKSVV